MIDLKWLRLNNYFVWKNTAEVFFLPRVKWNAEVALLMMSFLCFILWKLTLVSLTTSYLFMFWLLCYYDSYIGLVVVFFHDQLLDIINYLYSLTIAWFQSKMSNGPVSNKFYFSKSYFYLSNWKREDFYLLCTIKSIEDELWYNTIKSIHIDK